MSSTNERLDDSRCTENWVYKERMEEYAVCCSKSGPERCRLKESVGKSAGSFWCELILTVWGPKIPPVLLTATHLIRAKVLR